MKILITGGSGMVGSAFNEVETNHDLIFVNSKDADLRSWDETTSLLKYYKPDSIIHLAARVGGVKGNIENVAEYFEDNLLIDINLLRACRSELNKIPKVLSLLSTCIYPDNSKYPLTTDQIHNGPPHISNFGYAYSKRMIDVHVQAVYKQYGIEWSTAVPNNIYGKYDNFSLNDSHVIPALIRKIYDGKLSNKKVKLWGDGSSLREFTYSVDIAKNLLWLIENYDKQNPINIGNTDEVSIKDVADCICEILKFDKSNIEWDISQPSGQFRKPSDNSEFLKLCKDFKYLKLRKGLELTCNWYVENYPNIRGVSDNS
jgi:GDP-L-fucose synthase